MQGRTCWRSKQMRRNSRGHKHGRVCSNEKVGSRQGKWRWWPCSSEEVRKRASRGHAGGGGGVGTVERISATWTRIISSWKLACSLSKRGPSSSSGVLAQRPSPSAEARCRHVSAEARRRRPLAAAAATATASSRRGPPPRADGEEGEEGEEGDERNGSGASSTPEAAPAAAQAARRRTPPGERVGEEERADRLCDWGRDAAEAGAARAPAKPATTPVLLGARDVTGGAVGEEAVLRGSGKRPATPPATGARARGTAPRRAPTPVAAAAAPPTGLRAWHRTARPAAVPGGLLRGPASARASAAAPPHLRAIVASVPGGGPSRSCKMAAKAVHPTFGLSVCSGSVHDSDGVGAKEVTAGRGQPTRCGQLQLPSLPSATSQELKDPMV